MKITNPIDKELSIQVKGGQKYTIEAMGELNNIPTEHAEFWKGIHPFLKISSGEATLAKEEIKEEVVEEKEEEVVEEATETIEEPIKVSLKGKIKKVIKK